MYILNSFVSSWVYVEPSFAYGMFVLTLYMLFKNHRRRVRFVGLIPTVITVAFNKSEGLVLVGRLRDAPDRWAFPEDTIWGGIPESAVRVLAKANLCEQAYSLIGSEYLGFTVLGYDEKDELMHIKDLDGWSIFPTRWGKAYTAQFAPTRIKLPCRELNNVSESYYFEELCFVSIAEARNLLSQSNHGKMLKMYMKILNILEFRLCQKSRHVHSEEHAPEQELTELELGFSSK